MNNEPSSSRSIKLGEKVDSPDSLDANGLLYVHLVHPVQVLSHLPAGDLQHMPLPHFDRRLVK